MIKHPSSSAGGSGAERREARRQAFDLQVGVSSEHRLFVGLAHNISEGGLFIATDEHFKRGDRIEVRFSLPGTDHVFEKQAVVRWIRPIESGEENGMAGVGVQFEGLTDEETKLLNAFLNVRDPIFYDV